MRTQPLMPRCSALNAIAAHPRECYCRGSEPLMGSERGICTWYGPVASLPVIHHTPQLLFALYE